LISVPYSCAQIAMINAVEITNWKGHDHLRLTFKKGVNFLTGPNGAGKTSILDAICYAFLGNIDFIGAYHGLSDKNLIRDNTRDAIITLDFTSPSGDRCQVMRIIGNRKKASLTMQDRAIASQWQEVTERILVMFNATADFLGRCVFLTEGDTYMYIAQPLGNGLTDHIENTLGLKRLANIDDVLKKLNSKYASQAKDARKTVSMASAEEAEDQQRLTEYEAELQTIVKRRSEVTKQLTELSALKEQNTAKNKLLKQRLEQLTEIVAELESDYHFTIEQPDLSIRVREAHEKLSSELAGLLQKRALTAQELGRLTGLTSTQQSILNLMQSTPVITSATQPPCPVCKRPLSTHMIDQIIQDCSSEISALQTKVENIRATEKEDGQRMDEVAKRKDRLSVILTKLETILPYEYQKLDVSGLGKQITVVTSEAEGCDERLTQVTLDLEQINKNVVQIEKELAKLVERTDPAKIGKWKNQLISYERMEFMTQVFREALLKSQAEQRTSSLTPLTDELSIVWSRFLGRDVVAGFNDRMQLTVKDMNHYEPFQFQQLSGGEKTALLVLTQTALCRHFSNTDFMLVDEPLEHLDAVNRWALVDYLVEICQKELPRQLIVTTIEESYLREYLNNENVTVTPLSVASSISTVQP